MNATFACELSAVGAGLTGDLVVEQAVHLADRFELPSKILVSAGDADVSNCLSVWRHI